MQVSAIAAAQLRWLTCHRHSAARAAEADTEDEGEGEGGEAGAEGRPKKKRTKTHTTTLADMFDKIKVKDLDLEFTIDPLFKKTSADFDEGGAAGLLMNHLGSDSNMRVVFDAGDAKVLDPEDEVDADDDPFDDDEKLPTVDISRLKGKPSAANVDDKELMFTQPNSCRISICWRAGRSVRPYLASNSTAIETFLICPFSTAPTSVPRLRAQPKQHAKMCSTI